MRFLNTRRRKTLAGTLAAVAALGTGGIVWASQADAASDCTHPPTTWPLCPRSVAASQVVDNSLGENEFTPAVRAKLNKTVAIPDEVFGKQGGSLNIEEHAIEKIGGSFATNATKVGEFTLGKGTWLVNAAVQFDRVDANDPKYVTPTTDTMPSFVLRYPGDAGTIMGTQISRAGYTELNGSSVRTIVLTEDTKITAYGFGYNEDRSSFGSAASGVESQFSVAGSVTAVRVG